MSIAGTSYPCSSSSDSKTGFMYGVGGEINLGQTSQWGVRLEYDGYTNVGNKNNEYTAGNFSAFMLSGLYRF